MEYNLVQYLIVQLPLITFVSNGFILESPSEAITIKNTGGISAHWYDRSDDAIQILSRAQSKTIAKYNIDQVYELLKNRFGLLLPEVVVEEITYPAIQTYQISPVQKPGYLGADDSNLEMWSYNIMVTTK